MERTSFLGQRPGLWVASAGLVASLALATACAGPAVSGRPAPAAPVQASVGANGVQQIALKVGQGMSFTPASIAVKAGQPVRVTLESTGGGEHDFYLEQGVARPVKIVVGNRQTASGTFTIEQPGTYEFVCSVPGHAMAGMRGTIVAQ